MQIVFQQPCAHAHMYNALYMQAWVETKEGASAMAGVLTTLDVLVLGALWNWTGEHLCMHAATLSYSCACHGHLVQSSLRLVVQSRIRWAQSTSVQSSSCQSSMGLLLWIEYMTRIICG